MVQANVDVERAGAIARGSSRDSRADRGTRLSQGRNDLALIL